MRNDALFAPTIIAARSSIVPGNSARKISPTSWRLRKCSESASPSRAQAAEIHDTRDARGFRCARKVHCRRAIALLEIGLRRIHRVNEIERSVHARQCGLQGAFVEGVGLAAFYATSNACKRLASRDVARTA